VIRLLFFNCNRALSHLCGAFFEIHGLSRSGDIIVQL
jgi:hypothetical protein